MHRQGRQCHVVCVSVRKQTMRRFDFIGVFTFHVHRDGQQLEYFQEEFLWKVITRGELRQILADFRDILFSGDYDNFRVCKYFPRRSTGNGGEQDVTIGGDASYVR